MFGDLWSFVLCHQMSKKPGKHISARWRRHSPDQPATYWACSLAPSLPSAATSAPSRSAAAAPSKEEWRLRKRETEGNNSQMTSSSTAVSCQSVLKTSRYLCWSLVPARATVCGSSTGSPGTSRSGSPPGRSPVYLHTPQTLINMCIATYT